jgi:hypothetical protein
LIDPKQWNIDRVHEHYGAIKTTTNLIAEHGWIFLSLCMFGSLKGCVDARAAIYRAHNRRGQLPVEQRTPLSCDPQHGNIYCLKSL